MGRYGVGVAGLRVLFWRDVSDDDVDKIQIIQRHVLTEERRQCLCVCVCLTHDMSIHEHGRSLVANGSPLAHSERILLFIVNAQK